MTDTIAVAQSPQDHHRSTAVNVGLAAAASCVVTAIAWPILTTNAHAWILGGLLAAFGIPVAIIDVRTHKLPNRFVAPVAAAGFVQAAAIGLAATDLSRLLVPLISAGMVFVAYTAMGLAGWFGFGDAKFAAALTITVAISTGYAPFTSLPSRCSSAVSTVCY